MLNIYLRTPETKYIRRDRQRICSEEKSFPIMSHVQFDVFATLPSENTIHQRTSKTKTVQLRRGI